MEKQPNSALMLSLEQMALRRIAVAMYGEPRILASMATLKLRPVGWYENIWETTEEDSLENNCSKEWRNIVEDKMSKLQLPESLTKEMKPILKAVGSELFAWMSIHEEFFSNSSSFEMACFEKLRWTTAGTVDDRKTAEELVSCDLLDIAKRFELACLYCLEDRIPLLWEELPDGDKRTFSTLPVEIPHLQLFLPYILKKHPRMLAYYRIPCLNLFEESALCGHKTLAVYYYRKLAKEDRAASLVRTARNVIRCRDEFISFDMTRKNLSDVALYLLSLMTAEERMGIFQELPCYVLGCFLDWPLKDHFLEVADVIWTFLPESEYFQLMSTLYWGIRSLGYYFPSLFQDFFLRSPVQFKKCFVDRDIDNKCYFRTLFRNEDTDTVKVIFRCVDPADRVRLVHSDSGFSLIAQWSHKWHLVEVFLREAGLSKKNKERLKEDFIAYLKREERDYSTDRLREEHGKFFEFLEETDERVGKKKKLMH